MSSDLPPGVTGPIPNPTAVAEKEKNTGIIEAYPLNATHKSKLNVANYVMQFYIYTMHNPAVKLKNFIESLRSSNRQMYFHEKFRRVPEIWECMDDDTICVYEAEVQYKRDKMVDSAILEILENKKEHCRNTYPLSWEDTCKPVIEEFLAMKKNWHVKYAELGVFQNCRSTLNKQKNRFIEKRYKERVGMGYNEEYMLPDWAKKRTK